MPEGGGENGLRNFECVPPRTVLGKLERRINIDLTGKILKNRYCIISKIGEGGEGTTYLSRDMDLGTFWAIKQLPISKKTEAKLLKHLNHPSLPRMTDYTEQDDSCYLVMEYIKGKSLEFHLKESYQFSFAQILTITHTILQIFQYLHSQKPPIYYGDLKPDNLILDENGKIYLIDFGSALCSYKTARKTIKGTKGYAAPEQYEGILTAPSDFYALGKTLQKLCGKKKYHYYIRSPQFAKFIHKCCRQDPDKRWQNAEEAEKYLAKINWKPFSLKSVLVPVCAALLTLLAVIHGAEQQPVLPEFQNALAAVTARFYSMEYQSSDKKSRELFCLDTEHRLQQMLKLYRKSEEQIRLLELLAWNGELLGKANKAEFYYRQLITYEPEYGAGYLEFGNFLNRQGRYEQSMEVYREWEKQTSEKKTDNSRITQNQIEAWKKEASSK